VCWWPRTPLKKSREQFIVLNVDIDSSATYLESRLTTKHLEADARHFGRDRRGTDCVFRTQTRNRFNRSDGQPAATISVVNTRRNSVLDQPQPGLSDSRLATRDTLQSPVMRQTYPVPIIDTRDTRRTSRQPLTIDGRSSRSWWPSVPRTPRSRRWRRIQRTVTLSQRDVVVDARWWHRCWRWLPAIQFWCAHIDLFRL